MSGLNNLARGVMLQAFGEAAAFGSLHTSEPGDEGANEVRGDQYRRQPLSWLDDGGSARAVGTVTFVVPGATTITHIGYWSSSTGGEFLGSRQLDAPQSYTTAGEYRLTSLVESLIS